MIGEFLEDLFTDGVGLVLLAAIGLIVFVCYMAYEESVRWHKYAEEHHCKRTGAKQPDSYIPMTTCQPKGGCMTTIIFVPGDKQYSCDGNEIIWH